MMTKKTPQKTAPKTAPRAYSYTRFSTPEQAGGDSLRRQTALAREYSDSHSLELDDSLTFHDAGVSGLRGRNAEVGKLREFRVACEVGLVPEGSYLLVESLDRISRQSALPAMNLLNEICQHGITVVTLSDGREYTEDSLKNDPMSLLLAILVFIRANEESTMKVKRGKAAWAAKRAKATTKPLTARCVPWLTLDKATGSFKIDKDRAKIVRRIFDLTLKNFGQHRIAEILNRDGVATFGSSKFWRRTYLKTILVNPAVVGTLVPKTRGEDRKGKETRVSLDPVPNYYPAVVKDEVFQRVQSMRFGTVSPLRGRNARDGVVRNLFGGLAECPDCGARVTLTVRGPTQKGRTYLVCTAAKSGQGCKFKAVRYERVEEAFLRDARRVIADAPAGNTDTTLDGEINNASLGVDALGDVIQNVMEAIQQGGRSAALLNRLRELEEERDECKKQLGELLERREAVGGPLLASKLRTLEDALAAERMDRSVVNVNLRQVFSSVVADRRSGQLTLKWKHGGESSVFFAWPEEED
jgi:DNA invertase Pin-like site-specific DNA recombinase